MEITITTGISWNYQVRCENGHEVDSSMLSVLGRILDGPQDPDPLVIHSNTNLGTAGKGLCS